MKKNKGFQKIGDVFKKKKMVKAPAYEWQDLALKVIKELNVPNFKRSSVFKVCKINNKNFIEKSLIDTKELCKTNQKWQYFFKIINQKNKK